MGLAGADWLYTHRRPLGCGGVDQQRGWVRPSRTLSDKDGPVARGGCCETFLNRCTPVDWCRWRLLSDEHAHLLSTSPGGGAAGAGGGGGWARAPARGAGGDRPTKRAPE